MTDSLLDRTDPRARVLAALALSIVTACLKNLDACLAALACSIFLLLLSWPFPLSYLGRLCAANIFLAFMWLAVPWTVPGAAVLSYGFFTISAEGLNLCLLATLKANAIICFFLALAAPLGVLDLGQALYQLHCPQKLLWLFLLMGRNSRILRQEWLNLFTAAKLRGFLPGANKHSYRTFGALLALTILRSQERAERMAEAMRLRGFTGRLPYGRALNYSAKDLPLLLLTLLTGAIIIGLEFQK